MSTKTNSMRTTLLEAVNIMRATAARFGTDEALDCYKKALLYEADKCELAVKDSIQRTIECYLNLPGDQEYVAFMGTPRPFTLQCFAGMIETGEATYADFEAVSGPQLVEQIRTVINA